MMNEGMTIELPNFEGPLDLLLHLIRSQELDIYDIPIARITQQYLDYLQQMQRLNLQLAGEYFVMAATLLRIKSQYLLPKTTLSRQKKNLPTPGKNWLSNWFSIPSLKRFRPTSRSEMTRYQFWPPRSPAWL